MLHALDWMESTYDKIYDIIVLLQPTSPLRTGRHIDEAINIMVESDQPTLASVSGPHKKRHQIIKKPYGKNLATTFAEFGHEPFYMFNASIYCVTRAYLKETKTIFSDPHAVYVMNENLIDVDTEDDLKMADFLLNERLKTTAGI